MRKSAMREEQEKAIRKQRAHRMMNDSDVNSDDSDDDDDDGSYQGDSLQPEGCALHQPLSVHWYVPALWPFEYVFVFVFVICICNLYL